MVLAAKMLASLFAAVFFAFAVLNILEPAMLDSEPPPTTLLEIAPQMGFLLFLSLCLGASVANRIPPRRFVLAGLFLCPLIGGYLAFITYGPLGAIISAAMYALFAAPGVYLASRGA
ncbi:MAG: hypothetical protein MCM46_07660 [Candidatus Manganitrophus sp. SB1]|nr:hypothetical protein [Candidatus Manganitrophus morganii]